MANVINAIPPVSQMRDDQRQMWAACQQLEQVFLEILLQQMETSGTENGLFPKTFQSGIYAEMHRQSLAQQMAKSGGIGLAATLYRQLQNSAATPVTE